MAEEAISNGLIQNSLIGEYSNPPITKKKRNLPGNPDPEAEVIALSPKTLMATNRFLCEICGKGFQRDQNLQLHRRGHNLPWKLKQRTNKEVKKRVYVCPEKSCVHNNPSRALGDLTGIKKHFCRKHGEKKWKCDKCSKRYAVHSDWKAHSKTCGTREYKCDCGTIFSRRDSFITHRAFCDALAEETARLNAASAINNIQTSGNISYHFIGTSLVPNMAQNFSSSFLKQPISNNEENIDPTRRSGLSLWMNQRPQDHQSTMSYNLPNMHQIGNLGSIVPCSNPNNPSDYQMNLVFGSKSSSTMNMTSQELTSSTTSVLPLNNDVKGCELGHELILSVPSLYSTQLQNHSDHQTPSMNNNMSATALLQKAAQIGATSSSTDHLFIGSFGLMKSCDNGTQVQEEGNKYYCGLYGANTMNPNLNGRDLESSVSDLSTLNQMQNMYPSKRRNIQNHEDSNIGGQTRDFLGVGAQSICHPSSINGWT